MPDETYNFKSSKKILATISQNIESVVTSVPEKISDRIYVCIVNKVSYEDAVYVLGHKINTLTIKGKIVGVSQFKDTQICIQIRVDLMEYIMDMFDAIIRHALVSKKEDEEEKHESDE